MRRLRLPGFTAAATLGAPRGSYRPAGAPGFPEAYRQAILPQQRSPPFPGVWELVSEGDPVPGKPV